MLIVLRARFGRIRCLRLAASTSLVDPLLAAKPLVARPVSCRHPGREQLGRDGELLLDAVPDAVLVLEEARIALHPQLARAPEVDPDLFLHAAGPLREH